MIRNGETIVMLHDLIDMVIQLKSTKDGKRVSEIYLPKIKKSKLFNFEENAEINISDLIECCAFNHLMKIS